MNYIKTTNKSGEVLEIPVRFSMRVLAKATKGIPIGKIGEMDMAFMIEKLFLSAINEGFRKDGLTRRMSVNELWDIIEDDESVFNQLSQAFDTSQSVDTEEAEELQDVSTEKKTKAANVGPNTANGIDRRANAERIF